VSEHERPERYAWSVSQRWSSWDSPVGLGLFFVLVATAIDLVRLAFK
jgi:hypothetical protein